MLRILFTLVVQSQAILKTEQSRQRRWLRREEEGDEEENGGRDKGGGKYSKWRWERERGGGGKKYGK